MVIVNLCDFVIYVVCVDSISEKLINNGLFWFF